MPKYLAIFTCAENSKNHIAWKNLNPAERKDREQSGFIALKNWLEKFGDQIEFDSGLLSNCTKVVDDSGVREAPSLKGRLLVLRASSHEEAARLFVDHPHFRIFPGDGVEILECV